MTVAIAQMAHGLDEFEFFARASDLTASAASSGAQLIAFPETVLPGYPAWLDVCRDALLWDHAPVKQVFRAMVERAIIVPGEATRILGDLAREHGITLVIGVIEKLRIGSGARTLYNALLTFGPDGALLNHHRKLIPTFTERTVWGLGHAEGVRAVETPAGLVGGLICWEHWMPLVRQALHESGEEIHVAAWPMVKEMNLVASRHYAFEGRCFVLAAGGLLKGAGLPAELEALPERVSSPTDWVLRGGSCIIGPDGCYIVEPEYDREELIVATLDLDRIAEEAMTLDTTGHYARPDCFRLEHVSGARCAGPAGSGA